LACLLLLFPIPQKLEARVKTPSQNAENLFFGLPDEMIALHQAIAQGAPTAMLLCLSQLAMLNFRKNSRDLENATDRVGDLELKVKILQFDRDETKKERDEALELLRALEDGD